MDSHKLNKIVGSILGTVLFILVVRAVGEAIFFAEEPKEEAVAEKSEAPAEPAPAPAAETMPDFASMIPAADVMQGQMIAERCMVCHDWTKGGPTMIGPNLYGVVGRPKAAEAGFDYSPALREKGGNWTYPELYTFLLQPGVYAPGTKMAFGGIPRMEDRVNLIAFLRAQADAPVDP